MSGSTAKNKGPLEPRARPAAPPPWRQRLVVLLLASLAALGTCLFLVWEWRRTDQQAQRMTALALVEANRFGDAEPLLLRALDRNPRDLEVVKALALGHLAAGPLTDAEPHLTRWCELEPGNVQPFKLRMDLGARLYRREQALADGLRVLALEPDNDSVRRNVTWMLMAVGRLDEARRQANHGLARHPGDAEFRYLLARLHHVQGQPAPAATLLDALLGDQPGHLQALLLRGILYREMNEPERAVGPLRKVIAECPDPKDLQAARYHLAQALARCGQTKEADEVMKQFRRHQEADRLVVDSAEQADDLDLRVRAAEALLETGRADQAVRLLTQLLQRAPDCRAAHRALADSYERQGKAALADRHRRLAATSPDRPPR